MMRVRVRMMRKQTTEDECVARRVLSGALSKPVLSSTYIDMHVLK